MLEAVGGMDCSEDVSTKFAVGYNVVVRKAGGEATDEECNRFGVLVKVEQFENDMF